MKVDRRRFLHLSLALIALALGFLSMARLIATKPKVKRRPPLTFLPGVKVLEVKLGPHRVVVKEEGTVRPLREVALVPEVAGKVVYVSPALRGGGIFAEGEVLLRIDPRNYLLNLTLAEAEVKEAESQLALLEEEAASAREEWCIQGGEGEPPPLLVKEPQLSAARARLEAAKARLKRARLDLERTVLRAPFAGRVVDKRVDLGQYVAPGQVLATLYSAEAVEVAVPLHEEKLAWIRVPGLTSDPPGSPARLKASLAGRELLWEGEVVRAEGKVDELTRTVRVVIEVKDPFAKRPPLLPGVFVQVENFGRHLEDVALLPRSALHRGETVWVLGEGDRIRFRRVKVACFEGDRALIASGLRDGERVVLSSLRTVTEGMRVRVLEGWR
ncbi:MAG: efflux transporter periplasmic adaptor subunit [Deltaproteobacteria bacterium]|nr:MAG: efflux transporter periplasmic adaptor subunit [Deltaproteobacteria bacterium]